MAKKRRDSHDGGTGETRTEAKAARKAARQASPDAKLQGKPKAPHARRKVPNWPVLALALAGMALTAFLTITLWTGERLPYCEVDSPCDIVQSSRWSYFLGMPVSGWGFLAYAAIAFVAGRVRGQELHWKALWTFTLISAAVSVYLTVIAQVVLDSACSYCLASMAIAMALFAVVAWQYPPGLLDVSWPVWIGQTGAVAVIVVAGMHFTHSSILPGLNGEEDPNLKALAMHVSDSGAQFYGAFWCPNCQDQKEMFGNSAERLPYVECTPGGRNAPLAPVCAAQGITAFPTWVIDGKRYPHVLSKDDLVRMTKFVPPESLDDDGN